MDIYKHIYAYIHIYTCAHTYINKQANVFAETFTQSAVWTPLIYSHEPQTTGYKRFGILVPYVALGHYIDK